MKKCDELILTEVCVTDKVKGEGTILQRLKLQGKGIQHGFLEARHYQKGGSTANGG